jgi:hypothetical protein
MTGKETLFLGTPKAAPFVAVTPKPVVRRASAFEPIPMPPITYSNRPDDVTFNDHVLPVLFPKRQLTEMPDGKGGTVKAFVPIPIMQESELAALLNRLTNQPLPCTNAVFFQPTTPRPLVAIRCSARMFAPAGDAVVMVGATGYPSVRHKHTHKDEIVMPTRLDIAPTIGGDVIVTIIQPRDFRRYAARCTLVWWKQNDLGVVTSGSSHFQTEGLTRRESPEVRIPNATMQRTLILLYQQPESAVSPSAPQAERAGTSNGKVEASGSITIRNTPQNTPQNT